MVMSDLGNLKINEIGKEHYELRSEVKADDDEDLIQSVSYPSLNLAALL